MQWTDFVTAVETEIRLAKLHPADVVLDEIDVSGDVASVGLTISVEHTGEPAPAPVATVSIFDPEARERAEHRVPGDLDALLSEVQRELRRGGGDEALLQRVMRYRNTHTLGTPPEPPLPRARECSFASLGKGKGWGVKGPADTLAVGARVDVRKRDASIKTVRITGIIQTLETGYVLAACENDDSLRKERRQKAMR